MRDGGVTARREKVGRWGIIRWQKGGKQIEGKKETWEGVLGVSYLYLHWYSTCIFNPPFYQNSTKQKTVVSMPFFKLDNVREGRETAHCSSSLYYISYAFNWL